MHLRKYVESFQDVSYNFQLIDRLLRGQGLDGDYIREVPAFKVTGSLQADQLVVGSSTLFEEGYDPRFVAGEAKAYMDEVMGDLGFLAWEDAVEKAMLGATVIQGGYLVTGMIDASRIDTGVLNADRISARSISTDKITIGGVTVDNLANNSVTGAKIAANAIVAGHILAGEITAAKIASGQIEAYHIVSNAITATKIALGAVGANKLDSTVIDGGYIRTSLLTADNIATGTMSAGRIWGGTLSGVTLNISGDHTLGNKLILNANSFGAGIQWGSPSSAAVYRDPAGGAMEFVTNGPIYANGYRIDTTPSATATFG